MGFEIKIKPLVLFDLEDKINGKERQVAGSGKAFYEHFLSELSELQLNNDNATQIYQSVREYVSADKSCKLFYIINGKTLYIMGVL